MESHMENELASKMDTTINPKPSFRALGLGGGSITLRAQREFCVDMYTQVFLPQMTFKFCCDPHAVLRRYVDIRNIRISTSSSYCLAQRGPPLK